MNVKRLPGSSLLWIFRILLVFFFWSLYVWPLCISCSTQWISNVLVLNQRSAIREKIFHLGSVPPRPVRRHVTCFGLKGRQPQTRTAGADILFLCGFVLLSEIWRRLSPAPWSDRSARPASPTATKSPLTSDAQVPVKTRGLCVSDTSSASLAKFASAAERKDQYAGNQVGGTIRRAKVCRVTAGREHCSHTGSWPRWSEQLSTSHHSK